MCIYIGIEDLVANALIELLKRTERRSVSFYELDAYGAQIVNLLNERGEQAVLILSKQRTNEFLHDYSRYFDLINEDGKEGIVLREGVSSEILWEKFRGYLTIDVMKVFMSRQAVEALGV